jgi:phosphonate transport system permease protein
VRRKRVYCGLTLLIFAVLMVPGFMVADARNAGGFWDGLHDVGVYAADVLSEAWEELPDLPGPMCRHVPALAETVNIAAVSTLIGVPAGFVFAMQGTRGLAFGLEPFRFCRRITDIMRAQPAKAMTLASDMAS